MYKPPSYWKWNWLCGIQQRNSSMWQWVTLIQLLQYKTCAKNEHKPELLENFNSVIVCLLIELSLWLSGSNIQQVLAVLLLIDYCNCLHVYLYRSIKILYSVIASNELLKHVFYHYYMLSYHCQCMSDRTPGHVECVLCACVLCVEWSTMDPRRSRRNGRGKKFTQTIMEKGGSWLHLLPFKVITHLYFLWP